MAMLLPNWSPHPRQSPLGSLGFFLVFILLLFSVEDMPHSHTGTLLWIAGFLAAAGLCIFSLFREPSKLYGYTGMIATVLYAVGTVMAGLVGPATMH
jgi:hypothetical protein